MKSNRSKLKSKLSFSDHDMGSQILERYRIFHLSREDSVLESERLAKLLIEKCKDANVRLCYDVSYGGHPEELRYSEFFAGLGGISITPCCGKLIRKIYNEPYDTSNNIDYTDYITDRADKYILHSYEIEPMECSVILPGSNLLREVVNKVRLNGAASLGAKMKPHPLTNQEDLKRLKEYKDLVLPSMYSGFNVMKASRYLFSTGTSELGLYAMLLNKHVISIHTDIPKGGYYDIFTNAVKYENQKERLNWLLNHPGVGIIMPDQPEKIDQFLDYHSWIYNKYKETLNI